MENRPSLFDFQVLEDYDSAYEVWVARCLQTGSVVTAEDPDELRVMMKELLEDEIGFALEHGNLRNLFSSPAPLETWLKWEESEPQDPMQLEVKIPDRGIRKRANREVTSAFRPSRAAA